MIFWFFCRDKVESVEGCGKQRSKGMTPFYLVCLTQFQSLTEDFRRLEIRIWGHRWQKPIQISLYKQKVWRYWLTLFIPEVQTNVIRNLFIYLLRSPFPDDILLPVGHIVRMDLAVQRQRPLVLPNLHSILHP